MKTSLTRSAAAAAGLLLLAGCGAAGAETDSTSLTVAASVYPLEYVAGAVGGEHVTVLALTPPGVEPHDVELSPSTVRDLAGADLALSITGFQPAVDDAVSTTGVASLAAGDVIDLHPADHDHDEDGHDEDGHDEDGHDEESSTDEHDHGALDPHFWLDPTLLADYATAVAAEFAERDPDHAAAYTANADALVATLTDIDDAFRTGLAVCERDIIVVSHEAYGYLADAYDLHQEGIAGIDPGTEPSPARVREIRELVESTGATTIFTESLVNPAVAESIAHDAGVDTAVLDPLESVVDGDDYPGVMDRNLVALRGALACE